MENFLGCWNAALFWPYETSRFWADFWLEKEGIWTSVFLRKCSCNCELEIRLLNHPNWTSITQVIVHFPGLPQAALF